MKIQLFAPEKEPIINFRNLGSDKETVPAVVEKAQWYLLKRIQINVNEF